MDIQYYLAREGKSTGPFTWGELRLSAAKGEIEPTDQVWATGDEEWKPASSLPGLLTPPPVTPPSSAGSASNEKTVEELHNSYAIENKPEPVGKPAAGDELRTEELVAVKIAEAKRTNFVVRHWRGDTSLPVSYWVLNLLGTIVILAIGAGIGSIESDELDPRASGALILTYWLCAIIIVIWQVVGTWRSATKHPLRGGSTFWSVVAKIMVILGFLRFSGDFIENGIPQVDEALHLVAGIDRIPPYALRVLRGGTELELSGGMSFGTADAVTKVLNATPTIKVVHLNSIGGRLTEADMLAKIIREKNIVTYVATECDSACTIAFMAGSKRYLGDQAKLGFHSSAIVGSNQSSGELNQSMSDAYHARNITPSFISRALSTPPTSMWYPSHDELLTANAIDGVVDSRTYGMSGIIGWQNVNELEKGLAELAPFAMLKKYQPASYQKLRDQMVAGVQSGQSMLEIQGQAHSYFVKNLIPNYLQHGPDTPLVRYWKSQLNEVRQLAAKDPRYCTQFFYPSPTGPSLDLQKLVSADVLQEDMNSLASLIEGNALNPKTTVETPSINADIVAIAQRMKKKDPRLVDAMVNAAGHLGDPGLVCEASIEFYEDVISLPEDRAANLLRYMVSQL